MTSPARKPSVLRELLDSGAAGGLLLMVSAVLALVVANSDLADRYFGVLHASIAGLGPMLQDEVKVGVLVGSLVSALAGAAVLSLAKRRPPTPTPSEEIAELEGSSAPGA